MKNYAGICVGGPMAHKRIVSPDTVALVAKPYDFNPEDPWCIAPDNQEVVLETFEYMHFEVTRHCDPGRITLGFWIPREERGDSLLYVLKTLGSHYASVP